MKAFQMMSCSLSIALVAAACASGERAGADGQPHVRVMSSEPVLLTSSGVLELHVRDGRVFELIPATEPGQAARTRQIERLDDLRTLYARTEGKELPAEDPTGAVQVNGWVGLECVRRGEACGRQPDGAPRAIVLIRFH